MANQKHKQENPDIALLDEVYRNATMGERGTRFLIDRTEDGAFSGELHRFQTDYSEIREKAAQQLSMYGQAPRDSGTMENAMLWMGVELNTLIDKTPSHMAEMLIQGGSMGIVNAEKSVRAHENATPQAKRLAGRLLELQQHNIDTMKQYLN